MNYGKSIMLYGMLVLIACKVNGSDKQGASVPSEEMQACTQGQSAKPLPVVDDVPESSWQQEWCISCLSALNQ